MEQVHVQLHEDVGQDEDDGQVPSHHHQVHPQDHHDGEQDQQAR